MSTAPDTTVLPFTGSPIARKLALVMAEVHRVPKNGRNDFHKYDYIMEGDLVDALRGKLAEQGVAVFPSVAGHTTETITERNKSATLATVTLDVTFVDGESGDARTVTWIGQGVDSGDKAYYKAYTGAFKYALMKTFMVSSGDDPEVDEQPAPQRQASRKPDRPSRDRAQQRQGERATAKAEVSDPAVTHEINRFKALLTEAQGEGLTHDQTKHYVEHVCDLYGVERLSHLDGAQLGHVNKRIAAMISDERAGYMLAMSEGRVVDDVILPLPDAPGTGDRQATIKRWYAVAGEPHKKASHGQKSTAEQYRQALKMKWGVESFNDVGLATIETNIKTLKSLDLKERHIFMTHFIREASKGEEE